ncbi:hypothetical protein [Nonomuraea sediminis]|uniref:hypothetical protein n=1 Tax=Nonomuraea sediminis TaxID=2835864 RepID=UPI001BDCA240|nr:hypothetical protein [Nonomuraea sediminis]
MTVLAAGFAMLGIPEPDFEAFDRHIAALEAASDRLRTVVSDGKRAHSLAGANRGPATDAVNEYITGAESPLSQASDLHRRLSAAAGGLKMAKFALTAVGSIGAAIAAISVAAMVNPGVRSWVNLMKARLGNLLRTMLRKIGLLFKRLFQFRKKRRITQEVHGDLVMKWLQEGRIKPSFEGAMEGCLGPGKTRYKYPPDLEEAIQAEIKRRMGGT